MSATPQHNLAMCALSQTSDAVFWVTESGTIEYVNKAACRLLEFSESQLLRRRFFDIDTYISEESWPAFWETQKSLGSSCHKASYLGGDQKSVGVAVSLSVVTSPTPMLCVVATPSNVTDEANTDRLQLAVAASQAGLWTWDFNQDEIFWSVGYKTLLGYAGDEVQMSPDFFFSSIHPLDKARVKTAVSFLRYGHEPMDIEFRQRRKDGSFIWLHCRGRETQEDEEITSQIAGCVHDITAKKQAEQSSERLLALVDASPDFVAIFDSNRRIAYINAAGLKFVDRVVQDDAGDITLDDIIAPSDRHRLENTAIPTAAKASLWVGDMKFCQAGGQERDMSQALIAGQSMDGEIEFFATIARDVTEQKRDQRLLSEQARRLRAVNLELESHQGQLRAQQQELKAINQQLESAQKGSQAANNDLAETNQLLEQSIERAHRLALEAQTANVAKTEFLTNMSHEIRTPMTAILGYAELLAEGCARKCEFGDGALPEHVHTICRNGNHLLQIINDILDLSKIEAGRVTLESLTCCPTELVTDVERIMQVKAKEKGLALIVEFVGKMPETITTDPTRLRQILLNLVANAIKFTEDGSVTVVVQLMTDIPIDDSPSGNLLQFKVIDTGIGMSRQQMDAVFKPFIQADASITRKFGGTGLGLAISKKLAGMLGGDVEVFSNDHEGSTFSVMIDPGKVDKLVTPEEAVAQTSRRAEASAGPTKIDARVLLAEDGPDNQRLITAILTKAGVDVTVADNGKMALDLIRSAEKNDKPFDVILMDMQMPVMDGYSAATVLRKSKFAQPIIALTAHVMPGEKQKCLDAGCDDYATKPIDRAHLLSLIQEYAKKRSTKQVVNRIPDAKF